MIKSYKTKPVEIKAVEWTGENKEEVYEFANGNGFFVGFVDDIFFINTFKGVRRASVGDYIIKGVRGEFYPCKPDVFYERYEEVAE